MSLVSVVISLYNSRDTIERCVNSVIGQTHSEIEIILVDDGSDEEYDDIIQSFNDNRIIYYKLVHSNANVARNFGILKSKGIYVAMLDSDDMWLSNHLEDCLFTIEREMVDGLYGSLIINTEINGNKKEFSVRKLHENETMINYLLQTGYGAQTSTLFLSAESAKKVKWDESLKRHQDYDFVIRYNKYNKMAPKIKATVIHVISEKKKHIDFESCIRVIEKNEKEINPFLYNKYNQQMLNLSHYMNASSEIIRHYQRESLKNLEYVPYSEYILFINPKNGWEKLRFKLNYLFYIVRITID